MISKMPLSSAVWLLLTYWVSAREIVFPAVPGAASFQGLLRDADGIDISTGSEFHGLTTFANLPYAKCFMDSHDEDSIEGDIFLIGAPFDTVSLYDHPAE